MNIFYHLQQVALLSLKDPLFTGRTNEQADKQQSLLEHLKAIEGGGYIENIALNIFQPARNKTTNIPVWIICILMVVTE